MAPKKGLGKGLGKGIGSLIPTDERAKKGKEADAPDTEEKESSVKEVEKSSKKSSSKATKKTKDTKGKSKESKAIKAGASDDNEALDHSTVSSAEKKDSIDEGTGEITVKLTNIEPNKSQPRKDFDIEALKELSDSIKQFGLLQPILVRKKDEKYFEIIAGERRWRAAKLAGLKEVPVIVREFTPEQVMEAALIENIQRKDLNPIEEALAFTHLINEYDLKQEEVAERVSKSRAQISNIMRLLKLNPKVQQMVIAGELSMGQARAVLAINDEELQLEIAKHILDNDLSVRETEKYIKEVLEPRPVKKPVSGINPAGMLVYKDMEKKLSNSLGSKVGIKTRDGKKGKIEIEYSSNEELERLFDKLS